jgi:hypothetical protein
MSLQNAITNRATALVKLGKAALNVKYPDEFELYIVALELIDAEGKTLKYFIFPVNPVSIDETSGRLTNVRKTATGITTLSTSSFVPIDINLTGTFGRKFKVLLGENYVDFIQSFRTAEGNVTAGSLVHGVKEIFDERVKTGYGCLKILEDICNEADLIDEKGPRRLIWYNLAFGSAYLVRPMNFRINMAQDSNMLHNYYVSFKALAPMDALRESNLNEDQRKTLTATNFVQKQTDRVLNGLSKILSP